MQRNVKDFMVTWAKVRPAISILCGAWLTSIARYRTGASEDGPVSNDSPAVFGEELL